MTKKIYEYSPVTGEFLAETDATPDPLKSGEYLGRVHATFVVPPETGENEAAIWVGQSWEIKPDYRGKAYWLPDRTYGGEIKALGELADGALLDKPGIQLTLPEARADKRLKIDTEISEAIISGFEHEVDGQLLHFSYDIHDQQNFADTAHAVTFYMMQVEGVPNSITWNGWETRTDEQNHQVKSCLIRLTLTVSLFLDLYMNGALAHKTRCMETGSQRKAAVDRASTIDEVDDA